MSAPTSISAEARAHLRRSDPVMKGIVDRVGDLSFSVDPDLWRSLVASIVGQQLSVAAARTIRGRVAALSPDGFPDPELLLATSEETLRGCGLSRAKLAYLQDLAQRWQRGEIDPAALRELPDEEVIQRLSAVKGIGRWTAEMVLIFSMNRPDVLAVDDLGIRSAVQKGYGLRERPDKEELLRIGEVWRPFRSYASLYLWKSLKKEKIVSASEG